MDIENYQKSPISQVKDRFAEAVYDPTLLIKTQIETIEALTNNESIVMDPTHPVVALLEMSACMAANNIQESVGLLRRVYPELAETEDDLYLHMSDRDYLNRFATPTSVSMTFAFLYQDIKYKLVYDSQERTKKLIIPKESRVTVDNVTFMLPYAIIIRQYDTGSIQVSYDASEESPLGSLRNIVINPEVHRTPTLEDWIHFNADFLQLDYITQEYPIEKIYNFKKHIYYTNDFYFARVWYKNDNTYQKWLEMKTTHTDMVFDPNHPTALLHVHRNRLTVEIPIIYFTTEAISGTLRVDVYTTKGAITMNLANYSPQDFGINLTPIDEIEDTNDYTNAIADMSYYVYSDQITRGGKDVLQFEKLRERVIYNSIGPQTLPITNVQNYAAAENKGFEIVKNIDVVTNRSFLATRKLLTPYNKRLVTPANIGIITYAELVRVIKTRDNVVVNGLISTILSNTVYKNDNGKVVMLNNYDLAYLRGLGQVAMVAKINRENYYYSPFYYVMDESNSVFDLRVYALDLPKVKNLSFRSVNETLSLFVNTKRYAIEKTFDGYRLTIETKSGNYYKEVEDSQIGVQLLYRPPNEVSYVYIQGNYVARTSDNERIFTFDIKTNYAVNKDNRIAITNTHVEGIDGYTTWTPLEQRVILLHYTGSITTNYVPNDDNELLNRTLAGSHMVANAREEVTIHFGDALEHLWRRCRSYKHDKIYKTYEVDVPAFYTEDVYDRDPVTGSTFSIVNGQIVYNYLHREGDPVLDTDGNQVLAHKKGDVIIGPDGKAKELSSLSVGREMDILVVDARYYFADDEASVAYRDEIQETLTTWITQDIEEINGKLLEQTEMFFYPKTTLGDVEVNLDNKGKDYISAEQEFEVDLYVEYSIYSNADIRASLETATIKILDTVISETSVNMTDVREKLGELYGTSVHAFKISGLGGYKDYQVVSVSRNMNKLCLKKELVIQSNKKTFVKDCVKFNFKLVE